MAEQVMDKAALTFDEGCAYIGGVSRPTMYRLIADGAISSFKLGRRRYLLRANLDKFLAEMIGDD